MLLAACLALVSAQQGTAAQLQLPLVPHLELTTPQWPAPNVEPLSQPKQEPYEQQTTPENRGTEQIPFVIKELSRERTQEETKQREEKAELDRKLTAYTSDLARDTEKLFGATVGLAIVTGALALAAFLQIRAGRIAIGRQLRAYVYVADVSILEANSGNRPNIQIKYKNYGQTPAYEVRNTSRFAVEMGENINYPQEVTIHRSDLGPSQYKSTILLIPLPGWPNAKRKILDGAGIGVVSGEITYFDVFQTRKSARPRFTWYRFQIPVDDEGITDGALFFSDEGNKSS